MGHFFPNGPYDRDGAVNATDVLLARNNQTSFLNALKLIDLTGVAEACYVEGYAATPRNRPTDSAEEPAFGVEAGTLNKRLLPVLARHRLGFERSCGRESHVKADIGVRLVGCSRRRSVRPEPVIIILARRRRA